MLIRTLPLENETGTTPSGALNPLMLIFSLYVAIAKLTASLVLLFAVLLPFLEYLHGVPFATHEQGAVLVLGAGQLGSIGRDACLALADQTNLTLFCSVRSDAEAAALLTDAGGAWNVGALRPVVLKDMASEAGIAALNATIAASGLPLVGLVNAAGVEREGGDTSSGGSSHPDPHHMHMSAEFTSLAEARRAMEANVWGAWRTTQVLLPMLRASKGRVLNVGSLAGDLPALPGWSAYGTYVATWGAK